MPEGETSGNKEISLSNKNGSIRVFDKVGT